MCFGFECTGHHGIADCHKLSPECPELRSLCFRSFFWGGFWEFPRVENARAIEIASGTTSTVVAVTVGDLATYRVPEKNTAARREASKNTAAKESVCPLRCLVKNLQRRKKMP